MKAFAGKIGKYRQLSKRARRALYIKRSREDRKMNAHYRKYAEEGDYDFRERSLVEKLRIKKGDKLKRQQLSHEAWQDEMSSLCPTIETTNQLTTQSNY